MVSNDLKIKLVVRMNQEPLKVADDFLDLIKKQDELRKEIDLLKTEREAGRYEYNLLKEELDMYKKNLIV